MSDASRNADALYERLQGLRDLARQVIAEEVRLAEALRVKDDLGRIRVKVVRAAGTTVFPGFVAADPEVAQQHADEYGWCEEKAEVPGEPGHMNPKITLDSGFVIWGYECWWHPVDERGRRL